MLGHHLVDALVDDDALYDDDHDNDYLDHDDIYDVTRCKPYDARVPE